jgi:hypothetical protein
MDGHLLRAQLQARNVVVQIQHDTTSVVRRNVIGLRLFQVVSSKSFTEIFDCVR